MDTQKIADLVLSKKKFDRRDKRMNDLLDRVAVLNDIAQNESDTTKFIETIKLIMPLMQEASHLQKLNKAHTARMEKRVRVLTRFVQPIIG